MLSDKAFNQQHLSGVENGDPFGNNYEVPVTHSVSPEDTGVQETKTTSGNMTASGLASISNNLFTDQSQKSLEDKRNNGFYELPVQDLSQECATKEWQTHGVARAVARLPLF